MSDYHTALSDAAVVIGDLRQGVQPRAGRRGRPPQGGHLRHAADADGRAVGGAPGRRRRRAGRP
eukprot:3978295-Prymnesium_polylepis.1